MKRLANLLHGDGVEGDLVGKIQQRQVGNGREDGGIGIGPSADLLELYVRAVDGGLLPQFQRAAGRGIGVTGDEFLVGPGIRGGISGGRQILAKTPLMHQGLGGPGEDRQDDEQLHLFSFAELAVIHRGLTSMKRARITACPDS